MTWTDDEVGHIKLYGLCPIHRCPRHIKETRDLDGNLTAVELECDQETTDA